MKPKTCLHCGINTIDKDGTPCTTCLKAGHTYPLMSCDRCEYKRTVAALQAKPKADKPGKGQRNLFGD